MYWTAALDSALDASPDRHVWTTHLLFFPNALLLDNHSSSLARPSVS